jgi:hypothetical protein
MNLIVVKGWAGGYPVCPFEFCREPGTGIRDPKNLFRSRVPDPGSRINRLQ